MNNAAAAAVADACDKAAPSPCASGCGELPSLPPVGPEPRQTDSWPLSPSLLLGSELQGRLLNPEKGGSLGGGGCCLVVNSCGNVSPVGTVLLEARGRISAFQHCSLPLDPPLVFLTAPWKAGAGV